MTQIQRIFADPLSSARSASSAAHFVVPPDVTTSIRFCRIGRAKHTTTVTLSTERAAFKRLITADDWPAVAVHCLLQPRWSVRCQEQSDGSIPLGTQLGSLDR